MFGCYARSLGFVCFFSERQRVDLEGRRDGEGVRVVDGGETIIVVSASVLYPFAEVNSRRPNTVLSSRLWC